MNFNEYVYQRPNFDELTIKLNQAIKNINAAKDYQTVINIINFVNEEYRHLDTANCLVGIRNSINTTDEFYEKEQEFFDENLPIFEEVYQAYQKALLESNFRKDLEKVIGSHLFKMLEVNQKTFSNEIIEDLQLENKLITEYGRLSASAKIEYDGKVNNLPQMSAYLQSPDRKVRKEANDLIAKFLGDNSSKYDEIYDQMVKVRTTIAHKLGYENYVALGYDRLMRTDYDAKMVATYREQVKRDVLPLAKKIYLEQSKRLEITDMKNYDLNFEFSSGNPKPKGDRSWMVEQAKIMYHERSKETGEFFDFMTSHNLLDLDAKPGKQPGGYCTFIPDYASPFIFANFNGTKGDVEVLTHEAGHAFQVFNCRNFTIPEYIWPTYEACEIHSMSMEFLTWPWMNLFFKEDTDKFYYSHLTGTITFIPYGVCVDEFQHLIYEHPEMSKQERKATWRRLEKEYNPYKIYDNEVFEDGSWWYRQSHIFQTPFYYIDYTLAQVCAQQFWVKDHKDAKTAWEDYLRLCKAGGSKSFLDLLKVGNLDNPFIDGNIEKTFKVLKAWLDNFDQSKLK